MGTSAIPNCSSHHDRRQDRRLLHNDRYVVVAASAGAPDRPDWSHNLVSDPEVVIEVSETTSTATAVVLSGAQREALLRRFESKYPVSTSRTLGEARGPGPDSQGRERRPTPAGVAHHGRRQTSCTAVGRRGGAWWSSSAAPTHPRPHQQSTRAPSDASTVARPVPRRGTRGDADLHRSLPRSRPSCVVDAAHPVSKEGKRCLTRPSSGRPAARRQW